ncbi:MAG: hypothetical protein RL514_4769 [Verrucomicrobiota bacterium]|jgi:uncharacterized sporulation protein YeaH/YhbH (DUF444 family)
MSVIIEANYSKKIGLPGYSSHQYMLTLRAELTDLTQVSAESQRLHSLLQASVDRELQQPGWFPPGNGVRDHAPTNGNGHTNGNDHHPTNGNGNGNGHSPQNGNGNGNGQPERWNCSPKQQALILRIVDEQRLDKNDIEQLAQERFGKGVKQLNTLDASGLIEELFEKYPRPRGNGRSFALT